tara:strand:- start:34 stop:759 length:726 start_codon:yes stop_codon:yes gene_type:complete
MQKNLNKKLLNKKNNNFTYDALVIVPAFNEEKRVIKTINNLLKYFKNIILINDGSSDKTKQYAEKLKIKIINHPINLGQGAAIETGLKYFLSHKKFKYVITFDADGQHDASEALNMLLLAKKTRSSAVLGSRFLEKKNAKMVPFFKKIILKLAIFYERIFYKINLTDAHNGLRVLSRDIILKHILPISNYDMSHATEITQKIIKSGKKVNEYSVNITYESIESQAPLNAINIVVSNLFQPK